jgi:hypothetical protein
MTTTLYRAFNANGDLLYVGIAGNLGRRLKEHGAKLWWEEVTSLTTEHFRSRYAASAAEAVAIRAELPRYNVALRPEDPPVMVRCAACGFEGIENDLARLYEDLWWCRPCCAAFSEKLLNDRAA